MSNNPETKAMQDILDKLANASTKATTEKSSSGVPGNVSEDAQEMYKILNNLQNATESGAKRLVTESEPAPVVEETTGNSFGFGDLNVRLTKTNVYGFKKTYYTVTEGSTNITEELALFESAMAVIKLSLSDNVNNTKIQRIVDLDEQYSNKFNEAASYKKRAKTITESVKQDVFMAKHSVAVEKMKNIKAQIKKLL